jgi:hypothetical protein
MTPLRKTLSLASVALVLSSPGLAQTSSTTPQPGGIGPPTAVVAPGDIPDIPWHTFEVIERRYKIEAARFKALDETGIDWPGSDEVMVGTFDAKGWTVSNEIGDIDSGDTHNFDPAKSCILAVRPGTVILGKTSVCDEVGEPAPLSFQVEFWEKDVDLFGFCKALSPSPGFHGGPHCLHHGGDDFIGLARIELSIQELEAVLPNVGDEQIRTVKLFPCRNLEQVCATGPFDPDYTFTFRISRLPDVRVGVRSVLDEAIGRIGPISELQAIVAGLRLLRAPSPRKGESETVDQPTR